MGAEMKAEILVADDDRTVRRGVSGILADAGYAVREAKNGAEALKLFGESRPDLVLLDVMMPKSDGFAVCAAIRETDPSVPVLFLSALGDEESQLKGFGYGADDYIVKTRPASLLLARVEAALRRSRVGGLWLRRVARGCRKAFDEAFHGRAGAALREGGRLYAASRVEEGRGAFA